jgi:hypothetical protein
MARIAYLKHSILNPEVNWVVSATANPKTIETRQAQFNSPESTTI